MEGGANMVGRSRPDVQTRLSHVICLVSPPAKMHAACVPVHREFHTLAVNKVAERGLGDGPRRAPPANTAAAPQTQPARYCRPPPRKRLKPPQITDFGCNFALSAPAAGCRGGVHKLSHGLGPTRGPLNSPFPPRRVHWMYRTW